MVGETAPAPGLTASSLRLTIGGLVERLKYLKYGIAFILAFIGVKLVLHALHENELPFINGGEHVPVPEIGTGLSLVVIVVSMAAGCRLLQRMPSGPNSLASAPASARTPALAAV